MSQKSRNTKPSSVAKQPVKPEAKTLMGDGSVEVTNRETGAVAVEAPPAVKVKKSLRGKSTIDGPVGMTWRYADDLAKQARDAGQPTPKRSDVVNYCIGKGIAPYTARTQYQLWFTHTARGTKLMADGNIPKRFLAAEEPVEAAEETEAE